MARRKSASKRKAAGRRSAKARKKCPSKSSFGHGNMVGSRAQVMNCSKHHTAGGLAKGALKFNKFGAIVSKRASAAGKRAYNRLSRKDKAKFKNNAKVVARGGKPRKERSRKRNSSRKRKSGRRRRR